MTEHEPIIKGQHFGIFTSAERAGRLIVGARAAFGSDTPMQGGVFHVITGIVERCFESSALPGMFCVHLSSVRDYEEAEYMELQKAAGRECI